MPTTDEQGYKPKVKDSLVIRDAALAVFAQREGNTPITLADMEVQVNQHLEGEVSQHKLKYVLNYLASVGEIRIDRGVRPYLFQRMTDALRQQADEEKAVVSAVTALVAMCNEKGITVSAPSFPASENGEGPRAKVSLTLDASDLALLTSNLATWPS